MKIYDIDFRQDGWAVTRSNDFDRHAVTVQKGMSQSDANMAAAILNEMVHLMRNLPRTPHSPKP